MHERNLTWGNLEDAIKEVENREEQLFNLDIIYNEQEFPKHLCSNVTSNYEQYDFKNNLQHL
jgi:hypothetical protein